MEFPADRTLMLALANAVDGCEEEFNAWYDGVHIKQLLAVPGFACAQRFELIDPGTDPTRAAPPFRYMALYELEGSVEAVRDAMAEGRPNRTMSDALDPASVVYFFRPMGPPTDA